jgi:flagellar biosynthesis GTPase FlhF
MAPEGPGAGMEGPQFWETLGEPGSPGYANLIDQHRAMRQRSMEVAANDFRDAARHVQDPRQLWYLQHRGEGADVAPYPLDVPDPGSVEVSGQAPIPWQTTIERRYDPAGNPWTRVRKKAVIGGPKTEKPLTPYQQQQLELAKQRFQAKQDYRSQMLDIRRRGLEQKKAAKEDRRAEKEKRRKQREEQQTKKLWAKADREAFQRSMKEERAAQRKQEAEARRRQKTFQRLRDQANKLMEPANYVGARIRRMYPNDPNAQFTVALQYAHSVQTEGLPIAEHKLRKGLFKPKR